MATTSLLEKLSILFALSKSSIFYIIAIVLIIFLGLVLVTTNRLNVKNSRKLFILIYAFIITATIVLYRESLLGMYNYLMENLFVIIYFPNLAVYFAAILITNIILWFSVFNFKTSTIIKNINIIIYLIMTYLLVVLLSIVSTEKLDVFNQTSIYSNQSAQAIIELSSVLFITWIIFLVIYKAIMIYLTKDNKVIKNNKSTKVVVKNSHKRLPKNVTETEVPVMIKATPTFVPVVKTNPDTSMYENLLTIDDYKLLLNMLREKKEKEKIEITRKQKEEKELDKFRELQNLYGVR